ncbi:hypothetical protein SNEBB_010707 [Seison nebaliae]|nr:hypothetical protein SNEBB_010707 [Seison nebaliae]
MGFTKFADKLIISSEDVELRKLGYTVGQVLGEGSYAKVKVGYCEKTKKKVALKIVNKRKAPRDFQEKFLPRELAILKEINHPNIIQLYQVVQSTNKVYMIMEMAGHGDLLEYIKLHGRLSEYKAKILFSQLVSAVQYLHKRNIVHRDLKCENLLLDIHNNIKVSDFGFARRFMPNDLSTTYCGSAAYAAPEVLQGIAYAGEPYDIWSLGIILYIMVIGTMPFDDSDIKKLIIDQTQYGVQFTRRRPVTPNCMKLIRAILEPNLAFRATIPKIANHYWIVTKDLPTKPIDEKLEKDCSLTSTLSNPTTTTRTNNRNNFQCTVHTHNVAVSNVTNTNNELNVAALVTSNKHSGQPKGLSGNRSNNHTYEDKSSFDGLKDDLKKMTMDSSYREAKTQADNFSRDLKSKTRRLKGFTTTKRTEGVSPFLMPSRNNGYTNFNRNNSNNEPQTIDSDHNSISTFSSYESLSSIEMIDQEDLRFNKTISRTSSMEELISALYQNII